MPLVVVAPAGGVMNSGFSIESVLMLLRNMEDDKVRLTLLSVSEYCSPASRSTLR